MRFVIILFLFVTTFLKAQVNESFTDGDFTKNPSWTGDTNDWLISNGQLHSNSNTASYGFYLSTPSTIATDAQWEFYVNLQFQTSSSNYADIYLLSDSPDLKSSSNSGYFVRIGNTSDEISLYKKVNGTNTEIIDGLDAQTNTSNNKIKIKVTRDAGNVWTLQRDLNGTGINYFTEGIVTDATISTSNYFGVYVKQSTASFHLKHFFDDISVTPIVHDITAPSIVTATVISNTQVDVLFNETVDPITAQQMGNYSADNGLGNPSITSRDAANFSLVHLTFTNAFTSGITNTLTIKNVQDLNSNAITTASTYFTFYHAKPFDVVINEIMADPDPSAGLPNYEYVELYNRTKFPISIKNWTFTSGTTTKTLPDVIIEADSFMLITSTTAAPNFSNTIAIASLSSFPALTNTGQTLVLKTPEGAVMSTVAYNDDWYQDANKKEGGWSLEQIDPNNPCAEMNNWRASANTNGGTPGIKNSGYMENKDNAAPSITRVNIIAADTIQVYFNEALDSTTMLNPLTYSIDNGIGAPTFIKPIAPDFKSVVLGLSMALQKAIAYSITINNTITDCVGNAILSNNTARFAIPEAVLPNDIVINEILFDPQAGGVDFVEIYNRSNKVIDLKTMTLAQYDTINNALMNSSIISKDGYLIFPNEYLVLSENGNAIKSQYNTINPTGFLEMTKLPAMNIDAGTICIAASAGIIDNLKYDASMHFGLLNNTKGISLERIDFNRPTQDRSNWHSAAEAVGFATPAYKNSQYNNAGETDNTIQITPELFSPDEDGHNDVVNINYHFDTPGTVASISIYDSRGRLEKSLLHNQLLGASGTYSWDGINENREKSKIGIYVIYIEVVDLSGNVKHYKRTCVLAGKL